MKSYIETLQGEKAQKKVHYNEQYIQNEIVQEEKNGVIFETFKPVIKNPTEMNSEYKCKDFKLENIIKSGTIELLKESRLLSNQVSEDNKKLNELTEKIEKYVESQN